MHRISYIEIQNFRACQSVSLPLDDFTPLVGQNNVGKSTILESLRWLLKPDARSSSDFADAKQPIVVTARIEGISAADIWALLAVDADGKTLASDVHNQLKGHSIWIWKSGCIEHVTGTADKGEDAIIEQEEALRTKSSADVAAEFPEIVECFKWIKSFDNAVVEKKA